VFEGICFRRMHHWEAPELGGRRCPIPRSHVKLPPKSPPTRTRGGGKGGFTCFPKSDSAKQKEKASKGRGENQYNSRQKLPNRRAIQALPAQGGKEKEKAREKDPKIKNPVPFEHKGPTRTFNKGQD